MLPEQELIARYIRPLWRAGGDAHELSDDAAFLPSGQANIFSSAEGSATIVTTDTMVEGVHFLPNDPASTIARKLLRINLSDLAAMAATPRYYTLNLTLSPSVTESWVAEFCEGLAADQDHFAIVLIGGDTTSTPGPTVLTITATGQSHARVPLNGGQPGDLLYVSGTVGNAALGLAVLQGEDITPSEQEQNSLTTRYRLPEPRLELAALLAPYCHAITDLSDGLVGDAFHMAECSRTGIIVHAERIPLSAPASAYMKRNPDALEKLITQSDDYELLFAIAPEDAANAEDAASTVGLPITCIGELTANARQRNLLHKGTDMPVKQTGYQHFT